MADFALAPAEITVDVCQVCRGVWFDWFDGETSALAKYLDTMTVRAPTGGPIGRCPRDGGALSEHAYLDAGPKVQRCETCLGLFAPRAQIAALQGFHRTMPERSPEPIERTSLLARLWHAFAG